MKKFYSFILFVLLAAMGFAAQAAKLQFTLKVDVADRIVARSMSTVFYLPPEIVPLSDGENNVQANAEANFELIASEAIYKIASVTINGVAQEIDDPTMFSFFVGSDFEGSVVEVTTEVVDPNAGEQGGEEPQQPQTTVCKVSFDFADEAAKAYIMDVTIQNDPVDNWIAGFEVEKGKSINITLNTSIDGEITINGEKPFEIMGMINYEVTEDIVVYVKLLEVKDMTVTVNVDNAAAVEVGYNKTTYMWGIPMTSFVPFSIEDGTNVLTIAPDLTESLVIRPAAAGASIKSVTVNGEAVEFSGEAVVAIADGMVIDITTGTAERDAVATVNCYDPSAITLTVGTETVALESTSQQVPFFSESESTFVITPNEGTTIYSVTHNGAAVSKGGFSSSYTIYGVKNGDVINVVTVSQDFTLAFDFADEISKSAVTRVTKREGMYEVDITDQIGSVLSLPQGSYIAVYTDPNMVIEDFTVTGSELITYVNEYDFSLAGNTVVSIKASEKAKTKFTVDVDAAANVSVYYNSTTTNWLGIPTTVKVEIPLVDGENVIEMADAPAAVFVTAAEGAEIVSITVDGAAVQADTEIPVVNGMSIVIVSKNQQSSAISSALCGARAADVYSISGVKVLKAADAAAIRALPAGIYVVNGRKLVIR